MARAPESAAVRRAAAAWADLADLAAAVEMLETVGRGLGTAAGGLGGNAFGTAASGGTAAGGGSALGGGSHGWAAAVSWAQPAVFGLATDQAAQGKSGSAAVPRPEGYVVGQPVTETDQSTRGRRRRAPSRPRLASRRMAPDAGAARQDDKPRRQGQKKDLKSLAKTRGRDWGLRDAGRQIDPRHAAHPRRLLCRSAGVGFRGGHGQPQGNPAGTAHRRARSTSSWPPCGSTWTPGGSPAKACTGVRC